MSEDDLRYYERRAREEADAAALSTNASAASVHRLLAIEYSAHARELRGNVAQEKSCSKVTI